MTFLTNGVIAVTICACAGCSTSDPSGAATPSSEMLASVIKEAGFRHVLVLDRTIAIPSRDSASIGRAPAPDSALAQVETAFADLIRHDQGGFRLPQRMIRDLGVRAVRSSPRQSAFEGPDGPALISVSTIGFSSDSTFSAVYWTYYCGTRCAGATVSIFARSPTGVWALWRSLPLWMS